MNRCFKCNNELVEDVSYGLHRDCFIQWFGARAEFLDIDPKNSPSGGVPQIIKNKSTFFHGRYLKFSARLGNTEYILKVEETKFPYLPQTEYICNVIAEILNVEVPKYYLINFNGKITFVTRNFMQDYTGTLHHIYKFLPAGDENHNCEKLIDVILAQTTRLSEVVKFIEICLFDSLIGNNDRHGRNIGIIETSRAKILAPMYDNPSVIGIMEDFILSADLNPSGSIWTRNTKEPKPIDYINEFQRLGYESNVKRFCKKVTAKANMIIDTINDTTFPQRPKEALIRLFQKRIKFYENVK